MNCLPLLAALFASTLLTLPAKAADVITGKARIIDGDTIKVDGTRFRLEGIDAPERGQECQDGLKQPFDCGATAVRTLVELTRDQEVTCEPVRRDRFRRTIGRCRLPSGLDLNSEMLRQGQAVAFGRSSHYNAVEDEARRARIGLWAGTFEHPGCWRAQQRGNECRDQLPTN